MKQYIVDAFADRVFTGNQAAVCVMNEWPDTKLMKSIAKENNFSETAFAVKEKDVYHLRWFTPGDEVDFCGHATLGTSFVLFNFYEKDAGEIIFKTQVGRLSVKRSKDLFEMNFPAYSLKETDVTDEMEQAIGIRPLAAYIDRDLLLVLPGEKDVREVNPDKDRLMKLDGLITAVTAPSDDPAYDCVSRVFAPKLAIDEDPVTGSTHCMITPYWCKRMGKNCLTCYQASERTGILYTSLDGDRVRVAGKAVLYSSADILESL